MKSKIVLSKRLKKILLTMNNPISNKILEIDQSFLDNIQYNYIDISDNKSMLSFTPNKKIEEIKKKEKPTFMINQSGRYLTHSKSNYKIFKKLGYESKGDAWSISEGDVVFVNKEVISETTGRTYCLVKNVHTDQIGVINKVAIDIEEYEGKYWEFSRNPISVGRIARSILKSLNFNFKTKDIEDFVNLYKSLYDIMSDSMNKFEIVSGKEIPKWYSKSRYVSGGGVLNNSCMCYKDPEYFDIYAKNKSVSMLIYYSDDVKIIEVNGEKKYTSDKISGRSLIWQCEIDGHKGIFMDRVYTREDSDVELFKKYAQYRGWWYKEYQNSECDFYLTNGIEEKNNPKIIVNLDKKDFDLYPYLDTLCYLSGEEKKLSNREDAFGKHHLLRETDGDITYSS